MRREARIRENYDRIAASLSSTESSKFAARHPTRVIPDTNGKSHIFNTLLYEMDYVMRCNVHVGMFALSKTEIKKDTKEIEKHSDLTVSSTSVRLFFIARLLTWYILLLSLYVITAYNRL